MNIIVQKWKASNTNSAVVWKKAEVYLIKQNHSAWKWLE